MYSITAHDKKQPTYVDDAISGGNIAIPKNSTTSSLQTLGTTFNFTDCWLKQFQPNYQVILIMYHETMIKFLKQIPTMKCKPLSQGKISSLY